MILTDKAKEDFLIYYNSSTIKFLLNNIDFDDLPLIVKYSIIINWLDTVCISIYIHRIGGIISYHIETNNQNLLSKVCSREEATKQAIEKANEIYNNRFK